MNQDGWNRGPGDELPIHGVDCVDIQTRSTVESTGSGVLTRSSYRFMRTLGARFTRHHCDEDALDAPIIQRGVEDPDQELVPFELAKRIADGEHPAPVRCDCSDRKASEVAAAAGVAASCQSDTENGTKTGSVKSMKRIADAFNVTVDDLIQFVSATRAPEVIHSVRRCRSRALQSRGRAGCPCQTVKTGSKRRRVLSLAARQVAFHPSVAMTPRSCRCRV